MHHSIPAEHARHDIDLIAGHAAGDLSDTERGRADALLNSCSSCAELRRDLVAIASATRTHAASAPAPRDFRLTPAQAARLRRGGWIKALLRPFAAPGSSSRPLAMAFTSLGLAGLLVLNILPSLFGSTGALAPQAAGPAPEASAAAAATAAPAFPVAAGPQSSDVRAAFGNLGQPTAVTDRSLQGGSKSGGATTPPEYAANEYDASGSGQPSADRLSAIEQERIVEETDPILIGSLVLLALGLALFGLRFVARRVR
jgi:hypothetical protein